MSTRRFFRCPDCLAVVASDGQVEGLACGACDGELEPMGFVVRSGSGASAMRCMCDARCVFAHGPHCDCQCEGANHGSGMLGVVEGGKLRPRRAHEARGRALEWHSALAEFQEVAQALPDREKRRARNVVLAASRCRVHGRRMAMLREFGRGSGSVADVLELDLQLEVVS